MIPIAGASRMSSVSGLNASPRTAIVLPSSGPTSWIVSTHRRAISEQTADDSDRRRLTHVVSFRFERESENSDSLALEWSNQLANFGKHLASLSLIDFDHGINDEGVAVELLCD